MSNSVWALGTLGFIDEALLGVNLEMDGWSAAGWCGVVELWLVSGECFLLLREGGKKAKVGKDVFYIVQSYCQC